MSEVLEFPFDCIKISDKQPIVTKFFQLKNKSRSKCYFRLQHPLENRDFEIVRQKKGAVLPGQSESVKIKYLPKNWKVRETVVYFATSQSDELIPISLIAYPCRKSVNLPDKLDFKQEFLKGSGLKEEGLEPQENAAIIPKYRKQLVKPIQYEVVTNHDLTSLFEMAYSNLIPLIPLEVPTYSQKLGLGPLELCSDIGLDLPCLDFNEPIPTCPVIAPPNDSTTARESC